MHNACDILSGLQQAELFSFLKTAILVIAGFFLARLVSNASHKIISRYATSQQSMVFQKMIYFSILIIFIVAALQQLGFKLSVLLGSAGIATAAIAIASQTSISNIISGLFLILEKSFKVGDKIKIGNTVGTVNTIDLLSVKILSSNNTLIRIPNELLIKSEIINLTRFETRRLDLTLNVSNEEDIAKVKEILLKVAHDNHYVQKTPLPTVSIQEIDTTDVYLQLSAWSNQKNYDSLADSLYQDILISFREHDIAL